ncbi:MULTISPECIES: hypothetical protein [unclassified Burkholderia]|uniref:hypothetical protein n=1 Tax=unclassified Burkholderia TaxID=2613784 RepID=UPI001D11D1CA|nr:MULTISPECIES: hypothetical protein [unclassified Burkholderia]
MLMSFEYRIHTPPSADAFDAIANVLRQAHGDIDVDPHERRLAIRDAAGGWPLIDLSIEEAGFFLVTTLGPTRNAIARRDRTCAVGNRRPLAYRRRVTGSRD